MKPGMRILGLLWLVMSGLTLGGCTGSGSSGFDANSSGGPTNALIQQEQAAIEQVTQDGGCVKVEGTTICAPDTSVPASPGTNTLLTLTVNPPSRSSVACVKQSEAESCALTVGIVPSGFPAGTTFIAAVRLMDISSAWMPAPLPFIPSLSDPSHIEAMVQLGGLSIGGTARLQIAVLVYLPGTTLPPIGVTQQLLSTFQADVVFVVTDINLQAVASQ
jgi:hypothetical protein